MDALKKAIRLKTPEKKVISLKFSYYYIEINPNLLTFNFAALLIINLLQFERIPPINLVTFFEQLQHNKIHSFELCRSPRKQKFRKTARELLVFFSENFPFQLFLI